MNKSKRSRSADRLSDLPDSLIFHIFWFLPIRDFVRTTKLSKRWRNLWTTSPFLNFSDYGINDYEVEGTLDKVRNLFNRALLLWRGAKLVKFKVMLRHLLSASLVGDVNVWLRFAKEKEVKELFLHLRYPREVIDAEFESLWSCSSLEVLSMKGCPFAIGNGNVKWDRLKSLTTDSDCLRQDMLSKVLCGSPKLEEFILDYVDMGGNWCIHSTSLKKLSINRKSYSATYERNSEMKIQTPNLEVLEISGFPYSKFSMDVAPLTDVTLELNCLGLGRNCCEADPEFVDIKGTLEQIFPTIQHVESLTLSACCLEVLGVMNKKSLLSPLSKLNFLKLNSTMSHICTFSNHLQIAGLLQNFPKLKRLVIDDDFENLEFTDDESEDEYQDDQESLEFEANLPDSFLLQLRTVEVTWAECDGSIFSFIETLLKYASKLEKMVFRGVPEFWPPSSPSRPLFLASQKLLKMPRASPTAQLILCNN